MSAQAQQAMIAVSLVIGLIAFVFLAWIVCVALACFRDYLNERRMAKARRVPYRDLDPGYRTKQFNVPTQFRDFK